MTETTLLCVTCAVLRRLKEGEEPHKPLTPNVCDWCRKRVTEDLQAIPANYANLLEHLTPGRIGGERHSKGYESTPPLNIYALSLMGPGEDTPLARLSTWAVDWSFSRGDPEPEHDMTIIVGWLVVRLDWAFSSFLPIDEFAADVKTITRSLRPFQGRETGEPVGNCPRKSGDERCNAPLFVDPYVDTIKCQRCGMEWKRREGQWMHLRAQQIAAGVEVA